ncbi:uncharacterized protein LOC132314273 [Cornus florida]|uniref:uncharacterized protein LOC132314273 n=1 Tax=Cornus florida TaxID=4283 RepID=UPI00289B8D40|nr:uncharacterized protein LOC132314273 [Cornus florida]
MAQANAGNPEKIICPCRLCGNLRRQHFDIVFAHLVIEGMDPTYTTWVFHGENPATFIHSEGDENDMDPPEAYEMYRDAYFDSDNDDVADPMYERREVEFKKSLMEAETPLFPGCTKHLISAIIILYKHKAAHNLLYTGFDELLKIVRDFLPDNSTLPNGTYETKKLLKTFNLGYEKIDACINDCGLFRKDFENLDRCPKCGASRWKVSDRSKKIRIGIPAKVLRYFPIIPRLRRMFRLTEKAKQLLWHSTHKSRDGKMRHPVDSLAWDKINKNWPDFASEPRNLRLGLSTDGFNPFGDLSRPKQPGNDIDVFLEPLIENLKELWEKGVEIYVASNKSNFILKAILMWTIHDFPAYGNISGHTVKGKVGCQVLPVRHNLDVMHIEKNVCESIIGTLLNIKGKSKDGLNSRMDLEKMGIRDELHPKKIGEKYYLPAAPHTLSNVENSNIGKCVSLAEWKIIGLKSHDCHILMQQLLPVALRGLLPKGPRNAVFRLCAYFNEICQKVIDKNTLERCENDIAETLCLLERFFPPSFFDIMVHLTIHLTREARICGPVQYRWMYSFERNMKVLKGYVKYRSKPEGCIAERYMAEECVQFCSEYMQKAAEIGVHHSCNEDLESETTIEGRPISKGNLKTMHTGIKHLEELMASDRRFSRNGNLLQRRHMETFIVWFANEINGSSSRSERLKFLAKGPRKDFLSYSGYVINGQWFRTIDVVRTTQNSGVAVEAETMCRSSAKDTSQVVGKISYYGVLRDIVLLDFYTFKVPLFYCDWANIRNGVKVEDGHTLVKLPEGQSQFEKDPFILASQAKQVFYSRDTETSIWYVVLKAPPRGFLEFENLEEDAYVSYEPSDVSRLDSVVNDEDEHYEWLDCEGMIVLSDQIYILVFLLPIVALHLKINGSY